MITQVLGHLDKKLHRNKHNSLAINKDYKASIQDRQLGVVIAAKYGNLATTSSWRTPPPDTRILSPIFFEKFGDYPLGSQ
ncbi:hypothetical protein B9Z55_023513 [Caenorhabditis nigoni]|uniref:Uncharacterized protein n=1 Tax=Caenorhabditis nigoni TaxID=1611254 RepID=A0A2G5SQ31_9PELO|nr:hypothetical protein B9Z55_023513 [Caenorhabditis nigoni]